MNEFKLLLVLFLSLAGVIFYMAVAHDTSTNAWAAAGLAAVVAVAASLIELKRNPEMLLRAWMAIALVLTIFAGVTWFYTRGRAIGGVAAVSAPIALGLAIGVLRFRRRV